MSALKETLAGKTLEEAAKEQAEEDKNEKYCSSWRTMG